MKKLWILLVLVIVFTLPLQAQEYFTRSYDLMVTEDGRVVEVEVVMEFNVYGSKDVVMHMTDYEPSKFTPVTKMETNTDGDITYYSMGMKLSNEDTYFIFSLYNTGELAVHNLDEDVVVLLTNK